MHFAHSDCTLCECVCWSSCSPPVSGLVSTICPVQPLLPISIHGCATTRLHLLSSGDASLLNSMAFILSFCATVTRNMCNIEGAVNISLQLHQGHAASSYSFQNRRVCAIPLKGAFPYPAVFANITSSPTVLFSQQ